MLDDARIERLQDLFERALELPDTRRAEFLQRLSGDDGALREELRSLLEAHEPSSDFFDDLTDNLVSPAFAAVMDAAQRARAPVLLPRLEAALRDTYRVIEELGGGMSRVFLAEEIRLGRRVVIKVLPPELSVSGSTERFQREIQLAAQLQHPHIVPVLTSGTADSLPYYTMPFVAGESLRDRLRRSTGLSIAEARSVWHDMLEAVEHAHANGVVHRDIKPDNVLVSGRNAMVSDFGIARAIEVAGDVGDSTPGLTIGTPAYMAPEQITGDADVDHRVDIYAAGLVMYEMLEGRLPFSGNTNREMVLARLTHEPSPIGRPDCPPELAALVMRCLARMPAGRPASADAVLAELDALPPGGTPANAKPPTRRHRVAAYGVAITAVAAALGGARYLMTDRLQTTVAQTSASPPVAEARAGAPRWRHAPKTEAYEWYEKARDPSLNRTTEGRRKRHDYFDRAIAADSNFAAAYAGLASAVFTQAPESLARAEAMALESIRMDDSLGDGHAVLGWVRMKMWGWKDAEAEFNKAIALDPSAYRAYEGLARVYLHTERHAEQLAAARKAMDVDPNYSAKRELALAYSMNGRCDEAIELLRSHKDLDPPSTLGAVIGGQCHAARGMRAAAIAELRWAAKVKADDEKMDEVAPAFLAFVLARDGQRSEARRILSDLLSARRPPREFNIAVAYAGLRDYDAAFEWLDKAIDRKAMRPYLFGPMFEELRRDPRFARVRQRMGI